MSGRWGRPLSCATLVAAVLALLPAADVRAQARDLRRRPAAGAAMRQAPATSSSEPKAQSGTLLVHPKRGVSAAAARDAAQKAGARHQRFSERLGIELVSTQGQDAFEVADRLRSDPRVDLVEPNRIRSISSDPDDEHFFSQSNVFASRLPAAWDVTHGGSTIDIAVLDTGVDLNHPDLDGRLAAGISTVNGVASAQDDNGHGTLVAGVAAAETNNAIGIAGASWGSRIVPVKVLASNGEGTDLDIAEGITWAVDNGGAEILNMSFGGPGTTATLSNAVAYALSQGVVVVAAAGNEGSDVVFYPAAYEGVIAVGATDAFGDVAAFSNRGPWVDVVADGVDVVSTCLTPSASCGAQEYAVASGTSFSAPLVSGVAALVLTKNPVFTPANVLSRLRSRAIDRGPHGIDDHYGWGLVDAYSAVGGRTAASPPPAVRDALEPDDVSVDAHAIGSPTTATISPEGDADWFYVDAGGVGTITLTVTPNAADDGGEALSFDPVVTAWSPTLASLGTFDASGPGKPEVVSVDVAAGRHRFRISNFGSSRVSGPLSSPAPYSVSSAFVGGVTTDPPGELLWVSDVTPKPFARDLSATTSPTVSFARDVTEASAEDAANVQLLDGKTNTLVAATRTYVAGTKTVTIDPTATLVAGRAYVVRVGGVTDTGADVMDETFTSHFTVDAPAPALELTADFNNDGFEDTVIGVPGEAIGTKTFAGVVHVLYGGPSGPSASGSQMWHQNSSGIKGEVEAGDRFGQAVATGDLDRDGYDDLVVGVPFEDLKKAKVDAGAVHVIFGSASKLNATGNQLWTQDVDKVPGGAESGDRFGSSLAIGDFDGSSGDDLAIGVPNEAIGSNAAAGAVHILRSSSSGLTTTGTQLWTQDSAGIEFDAEAGDRFGAALGAGDFHGDTHDDLAIGAPSDNVSSSGDEGTVTLMRGTIVGLRPAAIFADAVDLQAGDGFGSSVAIADVGGYAGVDGYADLIVGIPGQDVTVTANAGRVDVIYSDHTEPWFTSQSIDQSTFALGSAEAEARFGSALSARRFGSRGVMAVGAPLDNVNNFSDAGSANIYESGGPIPGGYVGIGSGITYSQDSPGFPGVAETNDNFGFAVAVTDTDGDDEPDLVVSSPFEEISGKAAAGAVHSVRDATGGAPVVKLFHQNTPGIKGVVEKNDRFGSALS